EKVINTPKNLLGGKTLSNTESTESSETDEEEENIINMATIRRVIDFKKFSGKSNEDPEEWIADLDRKMGINGVEGDNKIKVFKALIEGEAAEWFEELNDKDDRTYKGDNDLVEDFIKRFKPESE